MNNKGIKSIIEKMSYRRAIFLSIILVSIGVLIINTSSTPTIGVVLIAIGGSFLIIGMVRLKKRGYNDAEDIFKR